MNDSEDPLGALVARSVGGDVQGVRSEDLAVVDGIERKRLRFTRDGRDATALFERSAKGVVVEAQLLPFLARKTDHVPRVHSRGIPPSHAALGPWLLLEDLSEAALACDGDPTDVIRAKIAIERAVAADAPALRALRVPVRTPLDVVRQEGTVRKPRASSLPGPLRSCTAISCASAHGAPTVVWSSSVGRPLIWAVHCLTRCGSLTICAARAGHATRTR